MYKPPEVARAMVEGDCGGIPVVDDKERMRPVGVVTDRDIVVRAVAAEQDARKLTAAECMTSPLRDDDPRSEPRHGTRGERGLEALGVALERRIGGDPGASGLDGTL